MLVVDKMEKNDYLVEGETLLYSAEGDNENLFFTDKRVLYIGKTGSFSQNAKFKDIMIHHISSVEWGTISYLWLLILGALIAIIGLASGNNSTIPMLIVGAILIALYFYYRKAGLIFITEKEKIPFRFGGADAEKIVKEITKIIRKFDK